MSEKKANIFSREFLLLCLSSFLFFTSFNMIIPELSDHLGSLGGESSIGWIIGLFTIAALISRPLSGELADQMGRIPVMIIGAFVAFACSLFYPFLQTVAAFLVLRFCHGFATGFHPTGTSAYMSDIIPFKDRGVAMGVYGFFTSMGFAVGPVIGSSITLNWNLDILYYTSSAMALLSILVILGMKETLKEKIPWRKFTIGTKPNEILEKRVIPPAVIMTLSVFAFGVVLTLIPDFTKHLELENKGIFFSIFMVSSVGVRIVAGRLSDIYGRERLLRLGVGTLALAMFILGETTQLWEFYTSAVLYGFAIGINAPILFAWAIDRSDQEHRGKAMGTLYMSLELGIGMGAVISGWIYNNDIEQLQYSFHLAGALCVIALIYSVFRKEKLVFEEEAGAS